MTKLILTDTEWISLIDGDDDESQLQKCCANISALRDTIVSIVRNGRNDDMMPHVLNDLKKQIKWVSDGHELSPLLKKVCEQLAFDPKAVEHEASAAGEW